MSRSATARSAWGMCSIQMIAWLVLRLRTRPTSSPTSASVRPAAIAPLESNGAAVGRDGPGDQVENGALAGAVGADHPQALARFERERHVVGDDDRAESLPQARHLEECWHLAALATRRKAGGRDDEGSAQPSCDRSFSSASTGIWGAVAL